MDEIRELHDCKELEAYSKDWAELLAQTPDANFFQSLDWFRVYLRHGGNSRQMRTLVVLRDGRPLGFVPLVIRIDSTPLGTIRTLTYPLDDWGTFYGPIGPDPAQLLQVGMQHIAQSARDWDVLDLHWINGQTAQRRQAQQALTKAGFTSSERLCNQVALIDLQGSWFDYLGSRKAKWRENLRRAERKVAAAGAVEYTHFRPQPAADGDANPRWYLYNACERLAARSWQGNVTQGTTLSHPSVRPFLRDAHRAATRAGAVDLHLLTMNQRPAAFLYNYVYRGRVYGLRSGFDPEFESLEVAKVLQARAVQSCFAQGDRSYDLGPDHIAYKRDWATQVVGSYSYCHYPVTDLKAQAVSWNRRVHHWLRSALAPPMSPAAAS